MCKADVVQRPAAHKTDSFFWLSDIETPISIFPKGWCIIPVKRGPSFRAYTTLKINSSIKQVADLNDRLAEFGTAKTLPSSGINNYNLTAGSKSGSLRSL